MRLNGTTPEKDSDVVEGDVARAGQKKRWRKELARRRSVSEHESIVQLTQRRRCLPSSSATRPSPHSKSCEHAAGGLSRSVRRFVMSTVLCTLKMHPKRASAARVDDDKLVLDPRQVDVLPLIQESTNARHTVGTRLVTLRACDWPLWCGHTWPRASVNYIPHCNFTLFSQHVNTC